RADILDNHSEGFISNLHRHGLIWYKLAMILTALRNIDKLHTEKRIICENADFILAFELMKTSLRHSQFTYNSVDNDDMSIQDEELLDSVKQGFTREELITAGEALKIRKRTIDDKIAQWKK